MGLVAEGVDTYCLDSLVPGRMARGAALVAQRCYHRLITPQGSLRGGEDEFNFGLDLASFVGSTDPRTIGQMLPVRVKNELLKDPAVDSVSVVANRVENAGQVSWDLAIDIASTSGDVELILSVSNVTVAMLKVIA